MYKLASCRYLFECAPFVAYLQNSRVREDNCGG